MPWISLLKGTLPRDFEIIDNLNIVFIIVSTTVLAGGHTQKIDKKYLLKSEILGGFAFEYVLERYFLFES